MKTLFASLIKRELPLFLGLNGLFYIAVSYMIASKVGKPSRQEQGDHPSAHGISFEEVEFESRGGEVTLSGWFMRGRKGWPTIIFVHGIGTTRSGGGAMELAARLVGKGFSVLLFDLRAHGDSGGHLVSGGYYEQDDVLGAFDFLLSRAISPEQIGLLGASMGAGTSLMSGAREPRIRAIVADSPYASMSEVIAREIAVRTPLPLWFTPVLVPGAKLAARLMYRMHIDSVVPERAAAQLGYPILVIHGLDDDRIPAEQGLRVYSAAHPESELWTVAALGHVEAFSTYPDEYVNRVSAYFGSRLDFL